MKKAITVEFTKKDVMDMILEKAKEAVGAHQGSIEVRFTADGEDADSKEKLDHVHSTVVFMGEVKKK